MLQSNKDNKADFLTDGQEAIPLVSCGKAAPIYIDSKGMDYCGLKLVADSFAEDIYRVTDVAPVVTSEITELQGIVVVAGSIGNNQLIDALISNGIINISAIENKRECYKLQVVENPLPAVERAIVIVGSDKRGTMYGLYKISELIGVSPWVYWADVVPVKQLELALPQTSLNITSKEPSVKYRGFFLNDEWPSLGTWVTNKFGGFNEAFYDKVFQLILRLKGNFLWPAMWSAVFSEDGQSSSIANAQLADTYGVVMGTSHHEPIFRAGEEWKLINHKYGNNPIWDFSSNDKAITAFWEDGLLRNKELESLITIGMRGEQDSALDGSIEENIKLLKRIIETQKSLLKKYGMEAAPQVLTIYKEVEKYWYGTDKAQGLRYWDLLNDVTIMLADDNFANLRTLPEEKERDRKAGWGMYYHFDYHGGPNSYEWVNTTPLEKVWEQMTMAYEYGVREIWIVNVGDLKPMEFPLSYFMDLAYDFETWGKAGINRTGEYTKKWVQQQFREFTDEVAGILSDYTKMNGSRKPEVTFANTYSLINYNEAQRVLARAIDLQNRAESCYRLIPSELKDAFYQLVYYPAVASANVVRMQIYAGLNNLYFSRGSVLANTYAALVKGCIETDTEMQNYYNDGLSQGKWKGMMSSPHIGYRKWSPDGWSYPEIQLYTPEKGSCMVVDVEGEQRGYFSGTAVLTGFSNLHRESRAISISNGGDTPFDFSITTNVPWIMLDEWEGSITDGKGISVSIDWSKVSAASAGVISINGAGQTVRVEVTAEVISTEGLLPMTFLESQGLVSMEAEHYTNNIPKAGVEWRVLENYGRTLSSVKMFPTTVSFEKPEAAPYLEYSIMVREASEYTLTVYTAPTNNILEKSRLRYGVAFDGEKPVVADALPPEFAAGSYINNIWCNAVLENIHVSKTVHRLSSGVHTLRFYGFDAGLVLQKLVLSKGELPYSYFGPEESFYIGKDMR